MVEKVETTSPQYYIARIIETNIKGELTKHYEITTTSETIKLPTRNHTVNSKGYIMADKGCRYVIINGKKIKLEEHPITTETNDMAEPVSEDILTITVIQNDEINNQLPTESERPPLNINIHPQLEIIPEEDKDYNEKRLRYLQSIFGSEFPNNH